jgi:hypothetical protein
MFFRVLTAMVTADAIDRHMREQQRRRWRDEQAPPQRRDGAQRAPQDPGPRSGAPVRHRAR